MKKPEIIAKEIAEARNKRDKEVGASKRPVITANLYSKGVRRRLYMFDLIKRMTGHSKRSYSYLTALQSMPEISENDLNFVKSLQSEYSKIPFEPLCWLVRDLRYTLNQHSENFNAGMLSMDENFWSKICSDDMNFKALTFESNNGQISITADSIIFQFYFLPIVEKLRKVRKNINDAQAKEMETSLNYVIFMKTWRFFYGTGLGPQQKRISTGMILQHFKLFGLTAQQDWQPVGSYITYKEYLNDRVKQMLKKVTP
jgi:hypothetical protein